ncbi:MAG: phosphoglucosamine mutase [Helicobacteraceae bacterium]|jgi:phosphoglucosamine mutase|nr:phosphoglucosamine mutase [Helicobacteraceae bacterium]
MKLFGTDGVRGLAGEKLSPFLVARLAMAAGIHFRKASSKSRSRTNKILVGKDTRRSGYMIENALVSGLTAVGYNAVQIGPMPTPAIAFLTADMRCDAGIMISASHNPFEDNGIKFFDADGNKLSGDQEAAIEEIFADENAIRMAQKTGAEIGSSKRIDDVIGRYIAHIKNSFPKELTLAGARVVIDAANGAAYKVAPIIFEELGAELVVIGDEPNGVNINDECGAVHPARLIAEVKRLRADIGFALDGDADRLVVVDERGESVDGDKLMGALAIALKNSGGLKGGKMAATVMSNGALEEFLAANGVGLLRSDVGDKNVLEVMQKNSLNFGGEQSGHIIFADYSRTGDGLVSALSAAALMLKSGEKASEIFNQFELFPQKQGAIKVAEKIPLDRIAGLSAALIAIEAKKIRHLIRYSGTENKLRILLEGEDKTELNNCYLELENLLKKAVG